LYIDGERRGGYIKDTVTGQDLWDLQAWGGRLGVDADVTDAWKIQTRVTSRREDSAAPAFDSFDSRFVVAGLPAALVDVDPWRIKSPTRYSGERRLTVASVRNTFDLTSSVQHVALSGYTNARFDNLYDTLGALIPYPIHALATSNSFSQELNLTGKTGPWDWIGGLYYFTQYYTLASDSDATNLGLPVSETRQHARQESISAFTDVTYNITDSTHVFGGVRAQHEKVRQRLVISDVAPDGSAIVRCPPGGGDPEQQLEDNAVTGRLGARHDVATDAMVYVQASRGYKAPGFSQSNCNNPFKRETVNALEVGFKSTFWDSRASFDVAAFFNDVQNLQLELAAPTGIPVVNAPRAHVYGAEFAFNITPLRALRVDATLSLLHARYTQAFLGDANLSPLLTAQDVDGNRLDNAPDYSGSLGVEYAFGLGRFGSLTPRADLYATSKYNLREVTEPWTVQGGYVSENFFLTYRSTAEHYQVRAWIKNASDQNILGGVLGFGGVLGSYLPPRTFGMDVTAKF
jgi:iron complex outermembrane receptor protein